MPNAIEAAYPFIIVKIDTSGLTPVAQRAPGVIAVVGKTTAGSAKPNVPMMVSTTDDAVDLFASRDANNIPQDSPLSSSLKLGMLQDPQPSKIYGVRVNNDEYAAALAGLEAADDVTFVALANESTVGKAAAAAANNTAAAPATALMALKEHVENMSAAGHKRIAVAMVNPATPKSPTYVADLLNTIGDLKSDDSRMVVIAARASADKPVIGDVAVAAMAAIAGYPPQISMVLKKIRGIELPLESQFSPSEIRALSEAGVNPIIQPAMVVGDSHNFADGRTFTSNADLPFIDIVRVLDDIDFRLKAGLIGAVGDARITRGGMTALKIRMDGILAPLVQQAVIDNYSVTIPVLDVLRTPEAAWSDADHANVVTARANRVVDAYVSITYGPAVHKLKVTLAPKF